MEDKNDKTIQLINELETGTRKYPLYLEERGRLEPSLHKAVQYGQFDFLYRLILKIYEPEHIAMTMQN